MFQTRNGIPLAPNNLRRTLRAIRAKEDPLPDDLQFHMLRKTVATIVARDS